MTEEVKTHPVQRPIYPSHKRSVAPQVVTLRAYEVYCEVFGPQEEIITGNCRGGFGTGELIAFLYARSFPKSEWRKRFNEALKGMQNL